MDGRVLLCGVVASVSAFGVPAIAQSAYAGNCHLIPKPGPFASHADHQRYQTEIAACLAQPPLPRLELDATIPLQAKPPQIINPLTALEQAARARQLQAQTEALRAQTEALRADRETSRSASGDSGSRPETIAPDGNLWRELNAPTRAAFAAGLLNGASGLSWRIYATDDTVPPSEAARLIYTVSGALNGISVGQLQDGLGAFYEDFRNRRIELVDAAYVVIAQIIGRPQQKIDETIERLHAVGREP